MSLSQQSGFPFPMISKAAVGRLSYVHNNTIALINASLLQILQTFPGERPWNPTFGCRVCRMQFEDTSDVTKLLITNLILEAIKTWEPRVKVEAADIIIDTDSQNNLNITINYTVINPDFTESTENTQVQFSL